MSSPIERVVIVVKENHGFDTYFGRFPGADGDPGMAAASSPPARDPSHTHSAWLKRATDAVREQYGEADIPTYWEYARQYTLCDRYFTDVAGPSTPNHLMLIAADSPWVENPHGGYRDAAKEQVDLPSLPAQLEAAGLSWGNYGGYAFDYVKVLAGKQLPSSQFIADAHAAKLPTVSWVYAPHPLSEHPPDTAADRTAGVGNVGAGMAWTAAQVDAIVAGGLWDSTAIFVTWDDWGGWADHVDPPEVEKWSDGTQFRYGNRVPCLVLGAYAKAGYVSKAEHSHVSLVRFCEQTFGLPSLNARTAAADDMGDCFDFSRRLAPPQHAPAPPAPVAPPPAPAPSASPQSTLTAVREAATRASARIAAASRATSEAAVREELRFAAEDVADISRLSGTA
jgi:phospholipase C